MKNTFTEEMRLHFEPLEKPFNVVLVEPEIPLNTGSIARLCAATGSNLIIIGKTGFSLKSSELKRAGVDYWQHVKFMRYQSIDDYIRDYPDSHLYLFSSRAKIPYIDCNFQSGDSLVFGKESTGLSDEILNRFKERLYAIPTVSGIRSLNLSNAVSIVLYEALKKNDAFKRLYWET